MLIKRWHKALKCWVYDVRLINQIVKKQFFPAGHTSIKKVKEYEEKLTRGIADKKMFPERFFAKIRFKDFVPDYLKKHASKKNKFRDYVSIAKKLTAEFGDLFFA